jgi:peptide-methionine (S)-S-oxide reductase
MDQKNNKNTEVAVFGGGCFWCTEPLFQRLKGVLAVTSGYAGGTVQNPSYDQVSMGNTGHAEVNRVEFDPSVISYKKLLEIFFEIHDPTTLNRQGNDVGPQYRSAIFPMDENQQKEAENYIQHLKEAKKYARDIVTKIEPNQTFYTAESYHQDYYNKNSYMPYCSLVISPKIKHFQEKYKNLLKDNT